VAAAGKSDVPLNSIIHVVFNQPMDGVSLPKALHLLLDGLAVPGTVSGDSTGGVILSGQFLPSVPLAPLSVYEVLVSRGCWDAAAALLEQVCQMNLSDGEGDERGKDTPGFTAW
jgi:hypothetical protein